MANSKSKSTKRSSYFKLGRRNRTEPGDNLVDDRNNYFGLCPYRNWKINWWILSADTITDTQTTFQRENLVTDSMGYFFHPKRALKTIFSDYFWRSGFIFKLFKNSYPQKRSGKYEKNSVSGKKIGSDIHNTIGLWFWFPIVKPGFGCTVGQSSYQSVPPPHLWNWS